MDAIELLKKDHRKVETLFKQIQAGGTPAKRTKLFNQIYHELTIHAVIEEQIFYPALTKYPQFADLLKDAYTEHAQAKLQMANIASLDASEDQWSQKVQELQGAIQHHVNDEEQKLFPQVQTALDANALTELGDELKNGKASNLSSMLLSQPHPEPMAANEYV